MKQVSQTWENRAHRVLTDRSFTQSVGMTGQPIQCVWHVYPGDTTTVFVKRV